MRKIAFFVLMAVGVSLFSCGNGNANQSTSSSTDSQTVAAPVAYDNSLVKGKVIDSVSCASDKNQLYALYLPSSYSSDKSFPCIYFFDAHARGALPLHMYKALAEQYGFVLIGSDVSKNGIAWEQCNESIKTLMADTREKINIDPKRIYTAGFSGGSRVASSVAIFDGGIAGVIGCAAGFPRLEQGLQNKFNYFGIVGEYDFNVHEMEQLDVMLEQSGFAHQLLKFDGIHGWASVTDMETGILWMLVNEIKNNGQPKNEAVIKALKADYDKRINQRNAAKDRGHTNGLLYAAIRTLDGLTDVSEYRKQLSELGKPDIKIKEQLQQSEAQQQQDLAKQFTAQDEKWWAAKISALNKSGNSIEEKRMNRRLLSYLGFVGYSYSNRAIEAGNFAHAETFLKLFKMVDPKNPDCAYLKAICLAKKGDSKQAIASLNEAASLGYNDMGTISAEPALAVLKNDPEYGKVLNKIIGNYKKD